MGAVYQARDLKRQAMCAIKEMGLSMVPPDERTQAIQNFKAEAHMLWGLSHPNLPTFTGFFSENQRYFMVMEYVEGSTLEDLLEHNGKPFSERRVLGWARQLCDVLEYLHSQNPPIIFRDMKPGNIMLTRDGHIKLIDFGIARFFRSTNSVDTQLLGTPGFAPPEQYGKAQTDERSDIYSLAITLFQLLTDTLSETGFGLKDVRSVNPHISFTVARALEKAASLDPEDRYQSVAEFRRALLGVILTFENGDQATSPEELADLCARYPDEAFDYLSDGEIESWLREIGEVDLARMARRVRAEVDDPVEVVEQFIQAIMGPQARIRSYSATQAAMNGRADTSSSAPAPSVPSSVGSRSGLSSSASSRSGLGWLPRKPISPVQVSPAVLDFGQVYPGISAPLALMITGRQGMQVRGTIRATEPWIQLDMTQFDGMSTRVNVRVNSTLLSNGSSAHTHYTGTVIISPDDEGETDDILVTVTVDFFGYATTSVRRGGKTHGANLDEDDDDYDDYEQIQTIVGVSPDAPTVVKGTVKPGPVQAEIRLAASATARDRRHKEKYGQPGMNGSAAGGWDPLQATAKQRLWMQRGFTFIAALMLASLCYNIVAQLPFLIHTPPLWPNPWFVFVLASTIPAATLGALLVHWNRNWTFAEAIDRGCIGMGGVLSAIALGNLVWQLVLHAMLPSVQLVLLLVIAALSASLTVGPWASNSMINGILWIMARMRSLFMAFIVVLGGALGFVLALGIPFDWSTPLGILVGVAVAVALVLRMDHVMQNSP
jgi:serine/threonine protein kinase